MRTKLLVCPKTESKVQFNNLGINSLEQSEVTCHGGFLDAGQRSKPCIIK